MREQSDGDICIKYCTVHLLNAPFYKCLPPLYGGAGLGRLVYNLFR